MVSEEKAFFFGKYFVENGISLSLHTNSEMGWKYLVLFL